MKKFRLEHWILLGLFGFLMALALTVDYHRVVDYMFSDEAVYYMMAQSFAYDQDLEYTPQDLWRVYEEGWYAGPQGVFLTKLEDGRIFYSKSFVYALFLAPFIAIFGFNGFLILNMFMLFLMIWMGWAYLQQFNSQHISLMLSLTFFLLSASFVYTFWLAPETFNMFCVTAGLFLWLYKRERREILHASRTRSRLSENTLLSAIILAPINCVKWLTMTPEGRLYLAPIPIGLACASKLPNILFIFPILADILFEGYTKIFRKQRIRSATSSRLPIHWRSPAIWRTLGKFVVVCVLFLGLIGLFYGFQYVFTGHFNPYAGDRKTFYWDFPFASPNAWEEGTRMSNEDYEKTQFYFHPKSFLYNIYYYFFGRFTGVLPYFFCALLALYYFLRTSFIFFGRGKGGFSSPSPKSPQTGEIIRRLFIVLTIGASIFAYIYKAPSNYQGGGGAFGNRFFINLYPAFLFLITFISGIRSLVVCWIIGSLFLAQAVLNPFQTSYYPASQGFRFPFRLLPVELTLIDTIPTNVNRHLVRMIHEEDPPFRLYFVDENVYDISSWGFWVQGERTVEMVVRTYEPDPKQHLVITISNGLIANQVDVTVAGHTQTIHFATPRETRQLVFPLNWSMPYFSSRLYPLKIRSHTGYVPKFTPGTGRNDIKFLGCRVQISLNSLKIGKAYLENGQFQEAIAVLEPVVKKSRKKIYARYYLAKAYHQTGRIDAALQELQQCKALLPDFQETIREDCESQGQGCLSEMLLSDPELVESHLATFLYPIIRRYEAEDTLQETGEVFEQQGASSGKVLVFNPMQHAPGYLVYGQNTEYQPGQYQARFRMSIRQGNDKPFLSIGTAVFFEVYDNSLGIIKQDRVLLENSEELQGEEFSEYTLNFDLAHPATLQFRVKTTGQAQVIVDKIDVYPWLPLQIYQTFARAKTSSGAYDEAFDYLQEMSSVDPWTLEYQQDYLKTLIKAEKWTKVLDIISYNHSVSDTHTGIASMVFEYQNAADSQLRKYLKELLTLFSPGISLEHTFADTISFIGYDLSTNTVAAGDHFTIRYFWKSLQQTDENYAIFVHFIKKGQLPFFDTTTRIKRLLRMSVTDMFQHDHYPLHGNYPTNRWLSNEILREQYEVAVPQQIEPGTYEIWIGVWNPLTKQRLHSNGKAKVKIGEIQIN